MASGTLTLTAYGKLPSYLNGRIVWSSTSNGTAANTSTVTAQIQISRNSSVATTGTWSGSLNVNGTTKQISYYASVGSNWVTIDTLTATVTHNADGSGNCYIYGVLNGPTGTTLDGTYVSGSATVAMDEIARFANITSATDFTDESNPTITFSNPAGNAVDYLQACISLDGSDDDVPYRDISPKTGTEYTFSLTESERNTLRAATPNSNSLQVKVFVRSKIGDIDEAYYKKSTMSIVNANPTLSPTVVDTNSTTINITGNNKTLVPGHSLVQAKFNATAKKYATITSRRLEHGNQILTGDGTLSVTYHPFRFIVTDSRGNQTIKNTNDTNYIVPYINPTCSIGNNMPATDGTFSLVVSGLFYNGSIGKTTNTLTVQYRRKTASGSYGSWTTIGSVTKSGNSYTATANLTGLDYKTVYTFQARAIDVLNTGGVLSAEKAVISQPVFDWGQNDFQFNVPVYFGDGVVALSIDDLNSVNTSGVHAFHNQTTNRPFDYGVAMTLDRYGERFTQIAFNPFMAGYGEICVRSYDGSTWQPWEYVNPPMRIGVEYRTTERWNSKVVYTKLVNYNGMPNSNRYAVSHGASVTQIVRCLGMNITTGMSIPCDTITVFADTSTITIITTANHSTHKAYVQIWYTKD